MSIRISRSGKSTLGVASSTENVPLGDIATLSYRIRLNKPRLRPQHIADLFEAGPQGIVEQVGVALRDVNFRGAYELASFP